MDAKDIKFCPRCGTPVEMADRFGKIRPVCTQCGWIHFADPKVAAAVLIEQNSHVLLVRRVNEPYRGLWTLPAGFVDAGEDPSDAAIRECMEETNLAVQILNVLDVIAGREHPRGADFIIVRTSPGGHPFDVALPAGASGTLELMITSGPAGSAASDWTYWSDLLLSSAR